jgi:archaellum biogenesis ATPase FlaH
MACFFCGEDETKRGRLYVNIDPGADIPGLFECKVCDEHGSLVSLKRYFGDPVNEKDDRDWIIRDILQHAASYYAASLADAPEALSYLRQERGLSVETIHTHQLGWADGRLHDHLKKEGFKFSDMVTTGLVKENGNDFLRNNITIPYHVSGNCVLIRGKEIGGKYLTPSGQKSRLYNSDSLINANEVIAAEGEFDALVAEQLGFSAVGVPGANTWQDSWDGLFTDVRRLYLLFDPDEAGRRGADKIHQRMSPRARVVNIPVPAGTDAALVDLSWLVVTNGMDAPGLASLLKSAGGSILVTVDDAWDAHQIIKQLVGIRFGIAELDNVITPGILPTQVMVVLARSGVGKTIWTINTMQRMAQCQPHLRFLFVSLEQTRWEWWERAERIFKFYDPFATEDDVKNFWRERYVMIDANRVGEDKLVAILSEYEYEFGKKPDVVFVDYLGYWAQSFQGERYSRTSDAMMSLKAIAKEHKLAIITPHQVSRGAEPGAEPNPDDARDSGVVLETSDFLLTLWNPDTALNVEMDARKGEVFGRLSKSRHGGVGTKLSYQFAPLTLAMVPFEDQLYSRAKREFEDRVGEDKWAVAHQQTPIRKTWQEAVDIHAESAALYAVRTPYADDGAF